MRENFLQAQMIGPLREDEGRELVLGQWCMIAMG